MKDANKCRRGEGEWESLCVGIETECSESVVYCTHIHKKRIFRIKHARKHASNHTSSVHDERAVDLGGSLSRLPSF